MLTTGEAIHDVGQKRKEWGVVLEGKENRRKTHDKMREEFKFKTTSVYVHCERDGKDSNVWLGIGGRRSRSILEF